MYKSKKDKNYDINILSYTSMHTHTYHHYTKGKFSQVYLIYNVISEILHLIYKLIIGKNYSFDIHASIDDSY